MPGQVPCLPCILSFYSLKFETKPNSLARSKGSTLDIQVAAVDGSCVRESSEDLPHDFGVDPLHRDLVPTFVYGE